MGYFIGDRVQMTENALENYGEQYAGDVFIIESVAYSTEEHPGYDNSIEGQGLYDLEGLGFSLYDYELEPD